MEDLKRRLSLVKAVSAGQISLGPEDFNYELVSGQLRKILELIAFASLTANKERYSEVHKDFRSHWNAKRLLKNLRKINPGFYPRPIRLIHQCGRAKHFAPVEAGFLTEAEFVTLYDKCGAVLHVWNPFKPGERAIHFGYSVKEWAERIQALLELHSVQLVSRPEIWIVRMSHPQNGKVHASIGSALVTE